MQITKSTIQRQIDLNTRLIKLKVDSQKNFKYCMSLFTRSEYLKGKKKLEKDLAILVEQQKTLRGFLKSKTRWGQQRCHQYMFNMVLKALFGNKESLFDYFRKNEAGSHSMYYMLSSNEFIVDLYSLAISLNAKRKGIDDTKFFEFRWVIEEFAKDFDLAFIRFHQEFYVCFK